MPWLVSGLGSAQPHDESLTAYEGTLLSILGMCRIITLASGGSITGSLVFSQQHGRECE